MKKTKTVDRVDAADAITHIIDSTKKRKLDSAKDIVGRVFGEVVKQMGLRNTTSMCEPYGGYIDSEVKKISKIASEIDYYLSCDESKKKCNGLYLDAFANSCREMKSDQAHMDVASKSARLALDSIRTKKNGIEMWYSVFRKEKLGKDPDTGKECMVGEYHECEICISPEATHLQKLKAASVFIKNMEKLCGREVFMVGSEVYESGRFRINVAFRVGKSSDDKKRSMPSKKSRHG